MKLEFYPHFNPNVYRKVSRYVINREYADLNIIRIQVTSPAIDTTWHVVRAELEGDEVKDYDTIAENLREMCAIGAFEQEEIYAEAQPETPPV